MAEKTKICVIIKLNVMYFRRLLILCECNVLQKVLNVLSIFSSGWILTVATSPIASTPLVLFRLSCFCDDKRLATVEKEGDMRVEGGVVSRLDLTKVFLDSLVAATEV